MVALGRALSTAGEGLGACGGVNNAIPGDIPYACQIITLSQVAFKPSMVANRFRKTGTVLVLINEKGIISSGCWRIC